MRRLLFFGLFAGVAGVASGPACGFPDVSFSEDGVTIEGGSAEDATKPASEGGSGKQDAESGAPATPDAGDILIDGSSPDALIAKDAGAAIDASGCAPSECDCDKDGFKETLKAGCSGGANDCDDNDSRAHPGQSYLEDPAVLPQLGDWDCNGTPQPLYAINVTCDGLTLGLGCSNVFGFEDSPGCGEPGSFIRCTKASLLSLACSVGSRTTVKQPCK